MDRPTPASAESARAALLAAAAAARTHLTLPMPLTEGLRLIDSTLYEQILDGLVANLETAGKPGFTPIPVRERIGDEVDLRQVWPLYRLATAIEWMHDALLVPRGGSGVAWGGSVPTFDSVMRLATFSAPPTFITAGATDDVKEITSAYVAQELSGPWQIRFRQGEGADPCGRELVLTMEGCEGQEVHMITVIPSSYIAELKVWVPYGDEATYRATKAAELRAQAADTLQAARQTALILEAQAAALMAPVKITYSMQGTEP